MLRQPRWGERNTKQTKVTCGKCGKIYAELEFLGQKIKKTNVMMLESFWTAFMTDQQFLGDVNNKTAGETNEASGEQFFLQGMLFIFLL